MPAGFRRRIPDSSGLPQRHPIDDALSALYRQAMCGNGNVPAENAPKPTTLGP
ncbi:hypothetical protein ACIF80_33050 [Streptomyces sp. NPDC085927]|uniref:hypothetical protein n=1 Tax=Streptomyces sp. NPDC085927 TaxID=3365738 RepID=UPI0037D69A9A